MATTTADVIEAVRRLLYTGAREPRNKLAGAIDAAATTINLAYPAKAAQSGAAIAIGLEECYVWSSNGNALIVDRGEFGTTATAHADGAVVTVNPKFSDIAIFRAINDELRDLSSPANGLFQMKTADLTWNSTVTGYDLAGVNDLISIYEVRYEALGPSADWPLVRNYDVARSMATDEFASGTALLVYGGAAHGAKVRVRYRAPFSLLVNLTDVVTTVTGLSDSMLDILALGAAVRLASGREIRRNFNEVQGDTRRAEEVPAGANLGAYRGLAIQRNQRIMAEASRLSALYPARRRRRGLG